MSRAEAVNTPSAKADGFFGELGQLQACTQQARSRPGALKNIPGGILVPIHHQTATAPVNTYAQVLGDERTAAGALLASVVREHSLYFTTGSFNLVREYYDEARPGHVANRLGKPVVPDHPSDVQAFHSDLAVAGNQIIRNFVPVLVAQISDTCVQPGDSSALLGPIVTAKFLAGKRSLRSSQHREFSFKKPGVLNFEAIGRGKKMRQSDIKSGRRKDVANFGWLRDFTRYDYKPFTCFTLQTQRLDFAFDLAVQTDPDNACMLDAQPISFEPDTVAVTGKKDRVKSVSGFETRISWFLTEFYTPEEISEGLIQTTQGSLGTTEIDFCEPLIANTLFFEPTGLVLVRARDLPFVIEPSSLPQRSVVEPPVRLEHYTQLALLISIGPETEFVGSEHGSLPFLRFYALAFLAFFEIF